MKFENIKSNGINLEYKVVFSAEEIEDNIKKEVEKKAKTFKMQGFRPGHVPLHIVRNNVEDSVIGDVLENLISDAVKSIVKDANIQELASRPVYKAENSFEKGKDLNLTMFLEAAPSFELRPYEMEITKIIPKVSDEDVEEAMRGFMSAYPLYEKAELGYEAKSKDKISYKADCYNNGIRSAKKSFGDEIILPDNIPEDAELPKSFIGKKVGDTFDFVPATDKNLTYKITIKSIKKAILDSSFDEFAKKKNFKDADEMRAVFRKRLAVDIDNRAYLYHKNQILEVLEKEYKFDLPQGILDKEMNVVLNDIKRKAEAEAKSGGKAPKLKSDEELKKEYEEVVRKRVLLGYILNKIAKEEKINVSEKDIQQAIADEINSNPYMSRAIIDYYSSGPEPVAYKKAEIIEQKVISFLISKAKVKEVEKTRKEVDEIVSELLKD